MDLGNQLCHVPGSLGVWCLFPTTMGSLCSKSSAYSGGHQVLGSQSSTPGAAGVRPSASDPNRPSDPRAAAAAAAEARSKAAANRGVVPSNPNSGKLAAQAGKTAQSPVPQREEEPLRWD
ncbi:hypothetical protein HGRIS_007898 [Hohenbuehelia grisea]|uniref:Uncharacterized protein n=1 Tax=Hohenbuehelia grisea TaxID=104357 RepID=A0ABR3J6N7_9AGAR